MSYADRLKGKLDQFKAQREQMVANVNALGGAIQLIEEELAEEAQAVKDSDHADGKQAT